MAYKVKWTTSTRDCSLASNAMMTLLWLTMNILVASKLERSEMSTVEVVAACLALLLVGELASDVQPGDSNKRGNSSLGEYSLDPSAPIMMSIWLPNRCYLHLRKGRGYNAVSSLVVPYQGSATRAHSTWQRWATMTTWSLLHLMWASHRGTRARTQVVSTTSFVLLIHLLYSRAKMNMPRLEHWCYKQGMWRSLHSVSHDQQIHSPSLYLGQVWSHVEPLGRSW